MKHSETKALVLSNFKYGLDTRRSELSSQPGVLLTAQDGHINAGGQFEKRKAFVRDATSFPSYTFGLQDTDSGLITFGSVPLTLISTTRQRVSNVATLHLNGVVALPSVLTVGMSVTISGLTNLVTGNYNGTYIITAVVGNGFSYANVGTNESIHADTGGSIVWPGPTLPTGVSYQYLAPPNGYDVTVDITMTAVVFSCNYRGKAFVLASFSNNSPVFAFYDGDLVTPTRNGIVLTIETGVETPTNLSSDLASQINDIDGWIGVANSIPTYVAGVLTKPDLTGLHLLTLNGSTLLYSPPGIHLTPVPNWVSTLGKVSAHLLDQNFDGSPGVAAYSAFTLLSNTVLPDPSLGTITVSAPANADGTGTANLTNGVINVIPGSLLQTATAVVTAINNNTFTTGYTASIVGSTITIFAPVEFGAVVFNLTVVTTDDLITSAPVVTPTGILRVSLTPSNLTLHKTINKEHAVGSISASVLFPSGAVLFKWEAVDNPDSIIYTPNSTAGVNGYSSASSCSFSRTQIVKAISGTFKVTAKDAANFTSSQTFTVNYAP